MMLVLVVYTVIALTYDDYGVTWDESYHLSYGHHIFKWYASGFRNDTAITYRIDYLYGGGFDLLGNIFRRLLRPMDAYQAIHLFGALIGGLGIVGTWKLGRVLGGPRAGFLAALMLALCPVYYGHMFNNPKDLPFAVGYVWGLYYLCAVILTFPRLPRRMGIPMAVAFGLASSVRIGGLLLFCYLAMAIVIWCIHRGWMQRSAEAAYRYAKHLVVRGMAVAAGAWIVMLASWPWALLDPLKRPLAALTRMSQFIDHRREMPFAGIWISNLDVPSDYLVHYFVLKLPELLVVLFVLGFAFGTARIATRGFQPRDFPRALALFILGFSIVFPPAYAVYKKSVLYDGLRHFLFLVPPMVVVGALALEALARRIISYRRTVGIVAMTTLVGVHVADQVATSIRYHPHQYTYFNRFIGGLEGADDKYSTDYYGETYKEALNELTRKLWAEDPEQYLNSVYVIDGCIGEGRLDYYLPGNFRHPGRRSKLDFWVGYTRQNCHLRGGEHPAYLEIRRDGGLLNLVRDLRGSRSRKPKTAGRGGSKRRGSKTKRPHRSPQPPAATARSKAPADADLPAGDRK